MELAVFSNTPASNKALGALLIAVGMHLLDCRESPGEHGILPGAGAVISGGNPLFESFYLRAPVGFPAEFGRCRFEKSEIDIIQLIPITKNEAHVIGCAGWTVFETAAAAQNVDLFGFDEREEVVF